MAAFDFPAYPALERTVVELGDLAAELLFVGGAAIGLYLTEVQVRESRPTEDVDVVCRAFTYAEYQSFSQRMRNQGFAEDMESGVICRWLKGGLVVDLMPVGESVLGFRNRWYELAFLNPDIVELNNGADIHIPTAPIALACKVEAFLDRGTNDFIASQDFEDIVVMVDGRPELAAEAVSAPEEVREFLKLNLDKWLQDPDCMQAIGGHLPPDPASQERRQVMIDRMSAIALAAG